jgi:hypothetical protein
MVDFEVGTTSVVGDVIILEATVRFHPTTIYFNGIPFIRKELLDAANGESEPPDIDLESLTRSRNSAKSKDSLNKPRALSANSPPSRQTSAELTFEEADLLFRDEEDSPSQKRGGSSSASSIPPPPPDDTLLEQGDIALFCAVCGARNEKLESTCPSCGSTLRISVLDPELGEQMGCRPTGSPGESIKKSPPPPPPLKTNGRAHLRANSPTREPPEIPTKRANTPQDPAPKPSLRPARTDLAEQLQQAKLKAGEDAAAVARRSAADALERAAEDAAANAASSDGDNDEKQSLRARRGNATKHSTLGRSSSAVALSSFKKLESRKAAELIAGSFPFSKPEEEKQEPTIFKMSTEFTDKDVGCFTVSIKNTSREDHVYYHIIVTTCSASWVLKKRESDMMDLWNALHENKVPDLPPRPRRTTGLGRRSGEELVKRMFLLQEMLEGILKNKRALAIRATSLFLELYRALLPS